MKTERIIETEIESRMSERERDKTRYIVVIEKESDGGKQIKKIYLYKRKIIMVTGDEKCKVVYKRFYSWIYSLIRIIINTK